MSKEKSVLSNTLSYGTYSAVTTLAMFLLHLVAARYLGVDDFGRFSFAIAFVTLFAPLLDPGIYYLLIREIARKKELTKHYLAHALTWKFLCSPLVFGAIYFVFQQLHKSPDTATIVYLMALSQILQSWKDAFRPILLAHEFFNLDAFSLAIERLSLLLLVTIVLVAGEGLLAVGWVFVIVRIIDLAIIALIVQYKVCGLTIGRDISFVKSMVINAVPIGAFYMTLSVYNYIDTVMLSVLTSNQEVGWYSASYKIYEGPVLIPAIIGTVFMPRLARLFVDSKDAFMTLFERGTKYVILVSVAVGINGIFLSEPIVLLTFGDQYLNSIISLKILLAGMIFVFTINFLQTVMISIDMQKIILYVSLLGLAMNVVVNLILIPLYGYIGAALATVTVEGVTCILLCFVIQKIVAKVHWWNIWMKPVMAGTLSLVAVLVASAKNGLLLNFVILNCGFIALLLVMKVFDKEEIGGFAGWLGMIGRSDK